MIELGIVGAKNAGKTTVIEGLIHYFVRDGYRVATIKHTSHSHRFDTPGKDTYRHRQAGALITIAAGNDETAIFAHPDLVDIPKLQQSINRQTDIWLIEGDRNDDRPKILVTRSLENIPDPLPHNILATIGPIRIQKIPDSFETGDYAGLGSFLRNTLQF